MSPTAKDPVREFEHSHGHLTRLALEIAQLVRADARAPAEARRLLVGRLEILRDELLRHFADEEEGLFPFVRAHLPEKAVVVDRLQGGHDTICGAIVRVAHFAAGEREALASRRPALSALYDRFESAYAQHSRDEAGLLEELGRVLNEGQRAKLGELLHGL